MDYDLTDLLDDGPVPIPAAMGEAELASFLGVEPSRVRTLARDKVIVRSARGRFDVAASTRNYLARLREHAARAGRPSQGGDALKAARTRLAEEQASIAAIKAAQARGELVSAEAVTREWQSVLRDVRAAVLAVPSRFGANMPHLSASDVAALDREMRAALEGLADGNN